MQSDAMTVERLRSSVGSILKNRPVRVAYVYGSVAIGNSTPLSDVDIALVVDGDLTPLQQLRLGLRLTTEIAEQTGVRKVEARVINHAPLALRGLVACRGILLYARDEASRVDFETATRDAYFDYQPVARRLRQAFFADLRERGLHGRSGKAARHPGQSAAVHRVSGWARHREP